MNILIIHQHYKTPETGGAIRSWYLAQALIDRGAKVTVITAHNGDQHFSEILDGVEVHFLPVSYDNKYGFSARVNSFLKFAWKSIGLAGRFKSVDYCYAISVPLTVGLIAMRIKKKFNIPFIFEVGDLWPEAPIQMGFAKNYFLKKILFALEKKIYRSSDSIVALSDPIKQSIEKKVFNKAIHVIPNIADTDFYRPAEKDPVLKARYNVEGKFVVSYIGAMGLANGLDYFIECAAKAQDQELSIHFILCGEGAVLERLKRDALRMRLINLTFVGFLDRRGVKDIMNITDASFTCYKDIPVLGTGSPNKFFDGLAAGKLIVVNVKGWMKDEIEKYNCGFYCSPHNPADFISKINIFVSNPEKLKDFQRSARMLAELKYSRKLISEKFIRLFF